METKGRSQGIRKGTKERSQEITMETKERSLEITTETKERSQEIRLVSIAAVYEVAVISLGSLGVYDHLRAQHKKVKVCPEPRCSQVFYTEHEEDDHINRTKHGAAKTPKELLDKQGKWEAQLYPCMWVADIFCEVIQPMILLWSITYSRKKMALSDYGFSYISIFLIGRATTCKYLQLLMATIIVFNFLFLLLHWRICKHSASHGASTTYRWLQKQNYWRGYIIDIKPFG